MNHKNPEDVNNKIYLVDMFYLNTIEQVFLLVKQLDQLVVCLTYSRPILTMDIRSNGYPEDSQKL